MEWSSQFEIGHSVLDEQNRELMECLHQLEVATLEQRTLLAVYCITRLKHMIRNHFATEERLLRECSYPDFEKHKAAHRDFSDKLIDLQVRSVSQDVTLEMVEFLSAWLVKHIQSSDRKYAPYLKGR